MNLNMSATAEVRLLDIICLLIGTIMLYRGVIDFFLYVDSPWRLVLGMNFFGGGVSIYLMYKRRRIGWWLFALSIFRSALFSYLHFRTSGTITFSRTPPMLRCFYLSIKTCIGDSRLRLGRSKYRPSHSRIGPVPSLIRSLIFSNGRRGSRARLNVWASCSERSIGS